MTLGILLLVVAILTTIGTVKIVSTGVKGVGYIGITNTLCIVVEFLAAVHLMR